MGLPISFEGDSRARRAPVLRARRQVAVYVALTLGVTFTLEAWMIAEGKSTATFVPVLMWLPALISIGMRLVGREGFADAGWRLGPPRYLGAAYALPVLCAAFTYGTAWAVGAVSFAAPEGKALLGASAALTWIVSLGINATLGVAFANLLSFGEELGWRGYLLTRLIAADLPAPILLSGLIWAAWHLPLVLWGDYATSELPWLSAFLFVALECILAYVFAWLRLSSGSIWPPVVIHSAHNIFYQRMMDRWFHGDLEPFLAGEAGLFSLVAYGALLLWLRGTRRLKPLTAHDAGPSRDDPGTWRRRS